jgi:restriction system protein
MAIPRFEDMMLPLLKLLGDGKSHSFKDAEEHLIKHFGLSEEEQKQQKPSGNETLFHNRLHWAKFYLKKAGLVDNPPRSYIKITKRGSGVIKENLEKIDITYLKKFQEFAIFVQKKQK